jgi:hypothetical protein
MIIQELAYKITVKADEFLNGKKKVEEGAKELGDNVTKELEGIGVPPKPQVTRLQKPVTPSRNQQKDREIIFRHGV